MQSPKEKWSRQDCAVQMVVLPEEENPLQGPFLASHADDLCKSHLLLLLKLGNVRNLTDMRFLLLLLGTSI